MPNTRSIPARIAISAPHGNRAKTQRGDGHHYEHNRAKNTVQRAMKGRFSQRSAGGIHDEGAGEKITGRNARQEDQSQREAFPLGNSAATAPGKPKKQSAE